MILDVVIEDPRWAAADLEGLAEEAIAATLAHMGLADQDWELTLLGCNDARIAELNAEFREKDKATNVLSWPAEELGAAEEGGQPQSPKPDMFGEAVLGDIAVSFETFEREAKEAKKTLADHLQHLIVHGTLHLLGYDHIRDGDATLMENLEVQILGKLGITDPYTVNDGPDGLNG